MKAKYIFFSIMILALSACKDDFGNNPVFGDNEIPYIYANYPEKMTGTAGKPIEYSMQVSPADGSVSVKWILDGVVISTTTLLQYTITASGTYILRFEATRNNITNYREYQLTIN